MMTEKCKGCRFSKGSWCNRLVVSGGFGMNDRVASDYLKRGEECEYREEGETKIEPYPNFNSWVS